MATLASRTSTPVLSRKQAARPALRAPMARRAVVVKAAAQPEKVCSRTSRR